MGQDPRVKWPSKQGARVTDPGVVVTRILVSDADYSDQANELATQFNRMTGETYTVVVGTTPQTGDVYLVEDGDLDGDYLIEQVSKYVKASFKPLFKDRILWHLLRHLGYRQFMPGDIWEHVPALDEIRFAGRVHARNQVQNLGSFGTGGAVYPGALGDVTTWRVRNGVDNIARVYMGHSWQAIIARYPELNDPQYQVAHKFNCLEPLVQQRALDYAKYYIDNNPDTLTVSMSASDGSIGWDQSTTGEHLLYNPSDRNLILANAVQHGLEASGYPYDQYRVAMYAYAGTSVTPTVQVHPKLVIGVADGYYRAGQTWGKVVQDYADRGTRTFAPYLYWEVHQWSWNEPGRANISRPPGWAERWGKALTLDSPDPLPVISGEGGPSWGDCGVAYYASARLWTDASTRAIDVSEDALKERYGTYLQEFLTEAFPNVREEMAAYFDLTVPDKFAPVLSTHLIHKCYEALISAMQNPNITEDEAKRVAFYIRYVYFIDLKRLGFSYEQDSIDAQSTWEDAMEWLWLNRNYNMVNWRQWVNRQPPIWSNMKDYFAATYGYELTMNNVDNNLPWGAESTDLGPSAMLSLAEARILENPTYDFDPVNYYAEPTDCVLADGDATAESGSTTFNYYRHGLGAGTQAFFRVTTPSVTWTLTAGLIYERSVTFKIIKVSGGLDEEVVSIVVPGDSTPHTHTLNLEVGETYRVDYEFPEGSEGIRIRWGTDGSTLMTWYIDPNQPNTGIWPVSIWWFWVPKGTEVIGGVWGGGAGRRLWDPDKNLVLQEDATTGNKVFSYTISDQSLTGRFWRIAFQGALNLLTVPPYLAQERNALLVPPEALESS